MASLGILSPSPPAEAMRARRAVPGQLGLDLTPRRGKRPRVVGYCRVSSEAQAQDGLSLGTQERMIRSYCTMRGLHLTEIVIDPGVSGGKALRRRKGGRRVIELLDGGAVAGVVTVAIDRMFRNVLDCLEVVQRWNERGVGFHVVEFGGVPVDSTTAMGSLFLLFAAGFAEFHRKRTSEKVKQVMADKAARGEWRGGHPPLGWRVVGKRLEEDPDEQRAIRLMHTLRKRGLSHWQIARKLDGVIPSKRGKRWHEGTVIRQLRDKVVTPHSRDGYSAAFHRRLRYHRERGASLRELPRLMLRDQYEPVGTKFHHASFARMLRGVPRGEEVRA